LAAGAFALALDGAVSAARCAGFFDMARLFSVTVFSDIRNKSIPAQSPDWRKRLTNWLMADDD
jgi:hypothetical protein